MEEFKEKIENSDELQTKIDELKSEIEYELQDVQTKIEDQIKNTKKEIEKKSEEDFVRLDVKIKTDFEFSDKRREESEKELKASIEKKLRGLAKKLRSEIEEADNKVRIELDDSINKSKQEINLIQSWMKVTDEKLEQMEVVKEKFQRLAEGDDDTFMNNFFDDSFNKSDFLTYFDKKFMNIRNEFREIKHGVKDFMNETDPCIQGVIKDISDLQARFSKLQMSSDAMSVTMAGL